MIEHYAHPSDDENGDTQDQDKQPPAIVSQLFDIPPTPKPHPQERPLDLSLGNLY